MAFSLSRPHMDSVTHMDGFLPQSVALHDTGAGTYRAGIFTRPAAPQNTDTMLRAGTAIQRGWYSPSACYIPRHGCTSKVQLSWSALSTYCGSVCGCGGWAAPYDAGSNRNGQTGAAWTSRRKQLLSNTGAPQ